MILLFWEIGLGFSLGVLTALAILLVVVVVGALLAGFVVGTIEHIKERKRG